MSMMGTLAKVAVGVAVAKGVSGLMKQNSAPQSQSGGLGGLLSGALGGGQQQQASSAGGLEGMLGSLLGGGQGSAAQGNGLGGLLEKISGGAGTQSASSGGLNGILGSLGGGGAASNGGLGALTGALGGLLGGGAAAAALNRASSGAPEQGFGDMLNQAIAGQGEPPVAPTAEQEALAALMLSAMIQAMKSDGHIDDAEQAKLMDRLGDIDDDERAFLMEEMKKPVDVNALAQAVPQGLEAQIYTMSVMGIDLDSQEEAKYLDNLAKALNLVPQTVNQVHEELGVPTLYS